jgi:septum formation protein
MNPPARFVYLASKSPRRLQLLEQLGVQCVPLLANASEDAEALEAERLGELPVHYVKRVTRAKALAAIERFTRRQLAERELEMQSAPIVVADTTVALGKQILGKPTDAEHAVEMLSRLSGKQHVVYTAVAIALPTTRQVQQILSKSVVTFAQLSESDIRSYVATGEPMDKAGAYGIQGAAGQFVRHISGSYTGIMGLPLYETRVLLEQAFAAG